MIHHVAVAGETDVALFLERYGLPHAMTPGAGAPQVRLSSVIGLGRTVTEATVGVRYVMLGMTRGAVLRDRHRERRPVTGIALNLCVPAMAERDVTCLRVLTNRDGEAHRDFVRLSKLIRLVATRARCRPFNGVVAALAIALGANDELSVALTAAVTGRAFDVAMLAVRNVESGGSLGELDELERLLAVGCTGSRSSFLAVLEYSAVTGETLRRLDVPCVRLVTLRAVIEDTGAKSAVERSDGIGSRVTP